ncbi:cation diffusion facilitator family transporter [Streptomyces sp. NPDC002917]|uniref:cation diffusion facilitator family transporter n=1 Tax=unclassified Streptomyces TaxID=2593676 RepID=UPI002E802F49|nr:cation diffusion facilitator family transporter [Streptomyces sp. NBC_00562]WTC84274.1 cation diffusion facilitator family transporter [Streptomyces sp. NBC_01653]WTD31005.1 cation diffusion facilitator family transporter [Streptomyces sp. NBC_01643]WTD86591.1 cation diffusion facilitator family transporter [Streptomyces sp. NBC_01637]WUC17669.1 cation diffusion facilitator family transporter [Streptomyces sp. NBC_00562]
MCEPSPTSQPPRHDHSPGSHRNGQEDHAPHGNHDHGHGPVSGHSHDHGDHGTAHDHGHHGSGRWSRIKLRITPHSHEATDKVDSAMESSAEGMRTLWISLAVLGVTTVLQALIFALSGSVALLGDTVHNAADALTAVPLGIAFILGRRAATRRFTYGFGRSEDLAGIAILLTITASSALAAYTAIDRLLNPQDITHLSWVAAGAVIGFIGNEWVARYRIRTGRKIGSAALVADGLHARTDGFTSLAVLLGAGGAAIGWQLADPIVGLLITLAILMVLKDAAKEVFRRLMDAVDPALVDTAESALRAVDGVRDVGQVRMRWIGHALRAEADIVVDSQLTVVEAHSLAVAAEHALIHAVPRLTAATVHTDHTTRSGDPHAALAHHAG